MKKSTIIMSVAILAIMSTAVSADIKKGQKAYLKTCKSCHGVGTKGAAMHTQVEWDDLFENGGAKIIKKHANTKAKPFFTGEGFKEHSKNLHDFLFNYGSDSGNVPSC